MLELRPRSPGQSDKGLLKGACRSTSCLLTPLGKAGFGALGCGVGVEPEVGRVVGIRA